MKESTKKAAIDYIQKTGEVSADFFSACYPDGRGRLAAGKQQAAEILQALAKQGHIEAVPESGLNDIVKSEYSALYRIKLEGEVSK